MIQWARAYAHESDREDVALGAGDTRNILTRLFVFDSFEESCQARVNLNQTRFQANQLVAFPPLDSMAGVNSHMMVLHWNVVVNDLSVALFRNVERRIRENDVLGKSLVWNKQQHQQGMGGSAHGGGSSHGGGSVHGGSSHGQMNAAKSATRPLTLLSDSSMTSVTSDDASSLSTPTAAEGSSLGMGVVGRWKKQLDNTRKAIVNRQDASSLAKGGTASGYSKHGSDGTGSYGVLF